MGRGLGDLTVRIVGDNSQLDKSIDQSQSKLKSFGDSASRVGKKLSTFVTLPIVGLGVAALKSAADMEVQQAAFETLLGSADAAKNMLQELTDFSAKTPFQLTDLANSTKTMLSFGIAVEDIMPNLQALGDIALGDSEKLKSLTLAFSQIQSTGRLMGQDLLQLINAGFNPLQIISQKTGESMADLKDRMSEGNISAREVAEAFKIATSEGGQFYGGMEKASKTLSGQISTLKDNIGILGRELVESLLPIIKDIVSGVTELVQKFAAMSDTQKKTVLAFAGIAAAAGPVISAIGGISRAFAFLAANPVVAVVVGIAAITAGIVAMASASHQRMIQDLTDRFGDLAEAAGLAGEEAAAFVDQAGRIEEVFSRMSAMGVTNFEEIAGSVSQLSQELGVSESVIAEIASRSETISEEMKKQLILIRDQATAAEQYGKDAQRYAQYAKEAREEQEKAKAEAEARAKAEEEAARQIAEQLKLLREQVIEDRIDAWDEYLNKIDQAEAKHRLLDTSQIEYVGSLLEAQKTYVNFLIESGIRNEETFNGHIEKLQELESWYNTLIATSMQQEEVIKTTDDAQKKASNNAIALLEQQAKKQQKVIENYKTIASTVSGYLSPVLMELGTQLVAEQFSWEALAKTAIEGIAQVIKSLAEQAAIQSAVAFATGDVARGFALAGASALGFVSAGVVSGLAENIATTEPTESAAGATAESNVSSGLDTRPQTASQTAEENMINLQVTLDSRPILEKVFPGTKNGTVLIDARAVV